MLRSATEKPLHSSKLCTSVDSCSIVFLPSNSFTHAYVLFSAFPKGKDKTSTFGMYADAVIKHPQIHEVVFEYCDVKELLVVRALDKVAAQLIVDYSRDTMLDRETAVHGHRYLHESRSKCRFLASCDVIAEMLAGEHVPAIAIPRFVSLLGEDLVEPVVDGAWAVLFVIGDNEQRRERLLGHFPAASLAKLGRMSLDEAALLEPVLGLMVAVAAGTTDQVQKLIDAEILPAFHKLLNHPKRKVRRQACSIFENVASRSAHHVQHIIDHNLVNSVLRCMFQPELEVKKAAVRTVCCMTAVASQQQILVMVSENALESLCDLVHCFEKSIVAAALEGIENILQMGEEEMKTRNFDENPYASIVIRCGGLEGIEAQLCNSATVCCERAQNILDMFFPPAEWEPADTEPPSKKQRQEEEADFASLQ